jgi:hypothetical protein
VKALPLFTSKKLDDHPTTMRYIIKTKSGVHSGTCNLGDAATEKEAWEDAFGPKPWDEFAKRSAKKAWCEKVDSDEPVSYTGNQ